MRDPIKLLEKFKVRAVVVHGDKYNYDFVESCSSKTPVKIICPDHGEFSQRKDVHLRGAGCPKCVCLDKSKPKYTTDEYIKKVKLKHPDTPYDYSNTIYQGSRRLVTIVCGEHGSFEQTANHHLQFAQCPECSLDKQRLTNDLFLERSKQIHKDKYDYSKVFVDKGFYQEIVITCPVHGEFKQLAGSHSLGKGCTRCGVEKSLLKRYKDYTTEAFIEKAVKVHGERYDYSLSEYTNTETKIQIICQEHGIFEQRPLCHVRGKGCVLCRNASTTYNFIQKYRNDPELGKSLGLLYIIKIFNDSEEFLKVGISSGWKGRLKKYKSDFKKVGYNFELLYSEEMENYKSALVESEVLKSIRRDKKLYAPQKDFSGRSECVELESLDYIKNLINQYRDTVYE